MLKIPTRHRRPVTRTRDASRGVVQRAGRLGLGLLVAFHAWLLWNHATLGKLLEPDVAVRWGLAGLLAAAFWTLHRLGLPLFRGRRAVVLWMLVVLIHCHAVWTGDAAQVQLAVPQNIVELLPAGAQVAAALTALLFLAWLAVQYSATHLRPCLTDLPCRLAGVPASVCAPQFSPRPPPVR